MLVSQSKIQQLKKHPQILKYKYNWELKKYYFLQRRRYNELLNIIKKKQITTFFQPIINLSNNNFIGYEVLNRPPSSKYFPTTEDFYQYLGETNQIFQFEKLSRQQSIERYSQLSNFNRESLLFLNVHPNVLNDENYRSGRTLYLIEKMGLTPKQIVFEITEKQAVQDYSILERVLNNYRSQGFRIAIDDIGSGYNSLKTMMYLQPDYIKLDRSFIQEIHLNNAQQKLVNLFVRYAVESGSKVIAEGVEHLEELIFLKEIGVDCAQGYYIGKPSQEIVIPL